MRISDWSSDVCSSDLLLVSDFDGDIGRDCIGQASGIVDFTELHRRFSGQFLVELGVVVELLDDRTHQRGSLRTRCDLFFLRNHIGQNIAVFLRKPRSEEHTSELKSLMRISYAVFCLKKKKTPSM